MDWVETFAPVLEEALLPKTWPAGEILIDDLPFHVRSWKTAAGGVRLPKQSGRRIFAVLAAASYVGGKMRIWRLHAVPSSATEAAWIELFQSLPHAGYPPPIVLSDGASGIDGALKKVWPGMTAHALCVYHLRMAIERIIPPKDRTTAARRALMAKLQVALAPPVANRDAWVVSAKHLPSPRLHRWLKRNSNRVRTQIQWTYWPVAVGALELALQGVKAMLDRRRWSYRNQKRMDRLLVLMALRLNGHASESRYSRIIRDHLLANHGVPYWTRHAVYDHHGASSLRRP